MISRFVKSLILRRGNQNFLKAQIRKSGVWAYRAPPPPPEKKFVIIAEVMGGFFWWWVLWHLWHDYGHVIEANPYRKRKLDVTKSDKKYKIEKLEQDVKYMDVDQIGSENVSSDKYVPSPLPPGEEYAGSSLIVCDGGKSGSQNTSRRASPTLIDLEEAKQRLMSELEEATTMNVSQMDCVSDNQSVSKYSNSLSVTAGTPIITGHSSYSTLPAAHKFSEGVSPYLPFDYLPDSVGTYEKIKDVVMMVRQRLQTLK